MVIIGMGMPKDKTKGDKKTEEKKKRKKRDLLLSWEGAKSSNSQ